MTSVRVSDYLALFLILIGIFIFVISLRESALIKYVGMIGSVGLIFVESVFLYQTWVK